MKEQSPAKTLFFVLWLILPLIIAFTIGAFFLVITLISLGISINATSEGDINTLNWSLKPALGFFVLWIIFFLPSIIIFSIRWTIKRYFKGWLHTFYIIFNFIAIGIIVILIIMFLDGKFAIVG